MLFERFMTVEAMEAFATSFSGLWSRRGSTTSDGFASLTEAPRFASYVGPCIFCYLEYSDTTAPSCLCQPRFEEANRERTRCSDIKLVHCASAYAD